MNPIKPKSNRPSLQDPDIDLMLKFQGGDTTAFEQLVRKYEASVLNTVYRYIGNQSEAEDVAQEVFLRVFRSQKSYRPTSPFRYWLFRILTNFCLNYLRDKKRHKVFPIFHNEKDVQLDIKDKKSQTITEHFRKLDLQMVVREAVNSLPAKQKMAVILNRYEEYPYEEIARIMKMSVSAIKSLLFRARESLKQKLRDKI